MTIAVIHLTGAAETAGKCYVWAALIKTLDANACELCTTAMKRAAGVKHGFRIGAAISVSTGGYVCDVLTSVPDVSAVMANRRKPFADPTNRRQLITNPICSI